MLLTNINMFIYCGENTVSIDLECFIFRLNNCASLPHANQLLMGMYLTKLNSWHHCSIPSNSRDPPPPMSDILNTP